MNNPPRIGFVGFGEAAWHIAQGLREAGLAHICAYDSNANAPILGDKIQRRAASSQVALTVDSAALTENSDVIFSAVTASSAAVAAAQTAPFLQPRHLYIDLNSVSPKLKQAIARTIGDAGARFVEAAVMAPVPPYGHRAPMLLGGVHAPAFVELFAPYGMKLEVVADTIGAAVAVKMCRSIIVKGLEALLFECVLGARKYGAEERVFASLQESFPGLDWRKMADYMVGRVIEHGERRAREMEEVAATLRDADIEPFLADAIARRQDWGARLNLLPHFGGAAPKTYQEVLRALDAISGPPQ